MVSVIIAAHDEEHVLGACLDALARQRFDGTLEVVVSANGCSDRTAAVAAAHGAVVVDRPEPGKAAALNAAEELTTSFPRIYLDADIAVPEDGVARLVEALGAAPRILASAPRRRVATAGRPLTVKAYVAINERLPAFEDGLFGRGMVVLSEAGRARFDRFPEMVADDLFLDSLFTTDERVVVPGVEVQVEAPRRTRALVARLIRVRRGNAQMRSAAREQHVSVRASDRWAWWHDVVAREPRLAVAAPAYVVLTLLASLLARRESVGWGHDDTTRDAAAASAA